MPIYDKDRVRFRAPPKRETDMRLRENRTSVRHTTKKLTPIPFYKTTCGWCNKITQRGTDGRMNLCMECGN